MKLRAIYFVLAIMLTTCASPARADLLRAKRASVMCSSGSALADLALPKGGSRTIGDHVSPLVGKIARDGGCIDFPAGNVVIVKKARAHTSIVLSDSLSGDGVMTEVTVANIDFEPYVPPHNVFYDTIRARCPNLLEGIAAEDPPSQAFVGSLAPPLRASIQRVLDDNCGPLGDCLRRNRAYEIGRRNLSDRWAAFLCAYPKDAVEPNDQSAGPAHD